MTLLTIFTAPKPMTHPHIATIQRNAIRSWLALGSEVEVLVIGEEEGLAETCAELGVRHLPDVARNASGTPLVSSIFDLARQHGQGDFLAYVNADIIFLPDVLDRYPLHGRTKGFPDRWAALGPGCTPAARLWSRMGYSVDAAYPRKAGCTRAAAVIILSILASVSSTYPILQSGAPVGITGCFTKPAGRAGRWWMAVMIFRSSIKTMTTVTCRRVSPITACRRLPRMCAWRVASAPSSTARQRPPAGERQTASGLARAGPNSGAKSKFSPGAPALDGAGSAGICAVPPQESLARAAGE
jgi:hypothetical protein